MEKRIVMILATAMAAMCASAEPTVTDVVAKQRYPWNGLVDITCKVTGISGTTNGLKFAVKAVMPDTGNSRRASNFWVVKDGTNSTDQEVHANGNYRLLWDARADLGQMRHTNMVVRVTFAERNFTAHDRVQLWAGGPYWATTNIGAEEPWEYGYYFWWGDTVGYTASGGTWTDWGDGDYYSDDVTWVASDGSSSGFPFNFLNPSTYPPTYNKSIATLRSEGWITADGVLALDHDAAHVQWGGSWRMPTWQELYFLCCRCDWTWTTMNGIKGYVVRGRGDFASNSIFLPLTGYCGGPSSLHSVGGSCCFWSSVPDSDTGCRAFTLGFSSSGRSNSSGPGGISPYDRYHWFSVRPVQEYGGTSGGGSEGGESGGGMSGGGSIGGGEGAGDESGGGMIGEWIASRLDTGFAKAQTVLGALYGRDGVPVGTVQVKVGKVSKKGVVKISASATVLVDGKAKKVAAKAVSVVLDATGRVPPVTLAFKAPIGEMAFEMAADGTFTLKNGSYVMAEKSVGGNWTRAGARVWVDGGRGATALPAGTVEELLPNGEPVIPKAGKWSFAKAAGVKWAKPKKGAERPEIFDEASGKGLIVDNTKGKTNLSGLKLTYTPKTGIFKGSFKIYAIQGGKLKKVVVKVIGMVVDGKGWGSATGPGGVSFAVTVE